MHDEAVQCITNVIDYCLCTTLDPTKARIILCGDFNDLRLYCDHISRTTGLKQIVNFPTRGQNTLDLIFTNFCCDSSPSCLSPIGKSDHVSISWYPNSSGDSNFVRKRRVRKFTQSSFVSFQSYISSFDWLAFVRDMSDLEDAFSVLLKTLHSVFDHFFPLRTVRWRQSDKPWVTSSLKLLINARDSAFSKGQSAKYLRLRQEVISHIKLLKSKFFHDIAASKNQLKIWQSIRSFSGLCKAKISSLPSAESFNEFFSSVFQKDEVIEVFAPLFPVADIFSCVEVHSVLTSLRRKSCDPDDLPYWLFRCSSFSLSPALAFLFNRSINECYFPSILKKATVCPIPKVSRPTSVSDFRPISLLPILSKVLEKLVSHRFILPAIRQNMTTPQFAYISGPGSGTCSSLTLTYDRIISFLDSPGAVRMLSIDFSKAFDKILHSSIVSSAINFRLPVCIVKWIHSFLSCRFQRVCVHDTYSSWCTITSGVPQGSVLGPLLFCMVVDNLSCVSSNSICVKYADDLTILHFVRNVSDDHLQLEWDNITQWSSANCLPINASKSCVMDVVTKKSLSLSPIHDHLGEVVRNVNDLTLLGVRFCNNMKWNFQIETTVKKSSRKMFIFYNLLRAGCPPHLLVQAYLSYVRSVLLYCYPVFCNAPDYLIQKLVDVEKRVCRITSVKPQADLLTAAHFMCSRLFTSIECSSSHPLRIMFDERHKTRRNPLSLRPPRARTKRYSASFIKFARAK